MEVEGERDSCKTERADEARTDPGRPPSEATMDRARALMRPLSPVTTRVQDMVRKSNREVLRAAQKQDWHVVNARGYPVGKLAAAIAPVLRGKHKPVFERNTTDMGDFVLVLNAAEIHFTGKKWDQKLYRWHTGYPGGLKQRTAREQQRRKPGDVLRRAIWGMLPKNKLRQKYMSRLRIYAGEEHVHQTQLKDCRAVHSPLDRLRPMKHNPYSKPASRDNVFRTEIYNFDDEDVVDDDDDDLEF